MVPVNLPLFSENLYSKSTHYRTFPACYSAKVGDRLATTLDFHVVLVIGDALATRAFFFSGCLPHVQVLGFREFIPFKPPRTMLLKA
jgi:hypothetical protein